MVVSGDEHRSGFGPDKIDPFRSQILDHRSECDEFERGTGLFSANSMQATPSLNLRTFSKGIQKAFNIPMLFLF